MSKIRYDGPILEIDQLSISFFTRLREIPAVMDFSVVVQPGEAVGLVGESGCGKSASLMAVMGLLPEDSECKGEVNFENKNLLSLELDQLNKVRGSQIAMVFQDPMMTLNPVLRIDTQMIEAHSGASESGKSYSSGIGTGCPRKSRHCISR